MNGMSCTEVVCGDKTPTKQIIIKKILEIKSFSFRFLFYFPPTPRENITRRKKMCQSKKIHFPKAHYFLLDRSFEWFENVMLFWLRTSNTK